MPNANEQKIAIVTGGSRGLGRNTAVHLARSGVDVIITYNSNRAEADNAVAEIEALGRRVVALQLDAGAVATFDAFAESVRSVLGGWGRERFDFLVNNAGTSLHASIAEHVTPYNAVGNQAAAAAHFNLDTMQGLIGLNGAISNQAAMLAYIDDFQLMMILTLATIPFLFLIKKTQPAGGGHAVME